LTGNNPLKFGGHTAPVDTVAWSPDGTRIASGSIDGTIEVWNPVNGNIFLTYRFAAVADIQHIGALQALSGGANIGVYTLAWSPDGTRIAAAMGSNVVQEFDARTGNTLFTYRGFVGSYNNNPSKINAMAWSPDGRYIITAGDSYPTTIWNANNGNTIFTYPAHDNNRVFSLAWSPDGKRVALGNVDGSARIWTPTTNNILVLNGHPQNIYALTWSPDGSRLATASIDDTVQVLNTTTGEQIYVYTGHTNELRTIAWAPSGKLIASGSADATVQVWAIP
jgi:WD40 repeat protein